MVQEAVFLDTNIIMYAAGTSHPCKAPCVQILADVEAGKLRGAMNTEVLQELLYRYHYLQLAEKGLQLCRTILKFPLTILPVAEPDIHLAMEYYAAFGLQSLHPRDAIHAATMKNHGIKRLISADRAFDLLGFLERIDPLNYTSIR
jgi:hypothetical protein